MILDWVQYVRREVHINNYSPSIVVSMDETNVDFDIMAKSTLDVRAQYQLMSRVWGVVTGFHRTWCMQCSPKLGMMQI